MINNITYHSTQAGLKKGKAPGPDGIPMEVIQLVTKERPELLVRIYNNVLRNAAFPQAWKTARLVLIEKPGRTDESISYRPICLLDSLSKVLEKILRDRLLKEIDERGGLSEHQFGFRKHMSTIDPLTKIVQTVEKIKTVSLTNRHIL